MRVTCLQLAVSMAGTPEPLPTKGAPAAAAETTTVGGAAATAGAAVAGAGATVAGAGAAGTEAADEGSASDDSEGSSDDEPMGMEAEGETLGAETLTSPTLDPLTSGTPLTRGPLEVLGGRAVVPVHQQLAVVAHAYEVQRVLVRRVLPVLHKMLVTSGYKGDALPVARAPVALAVAKLVRGGMESLCHGCGVKHGQTGSLENVALEGFCMKTRQGWQVIKTKRNMPALACSITAPHTLDHANLIVNLTVADT